MDPAVHSVNLMNTQVFQLAIPYTPSVNEYVQSVSLPGVTLGEAFMETPLIKSPEPGDKLIYSPLAITFLVDEGLKNWKELYDWLKSLGFPTDMTQYGVLPHLLNRVDDDRVVCDITMLIYNNQTQPILKTVFFDCFPISIGDIPLNVADTGSQPTICTADFMYRSYEVTTIS